jgi:branched-chain amino acid transport system substrate-binding protein
MTRWFLAGVALGFALTFAHSTSAQIKLGVAGPMSGGSAAFGAQLRHGVEQAIEDINSEGGILGQKIQAPPFVGDDRSDPKEGVLVANKFVAEGVKFVVGHFHSLITIHASEVYQKNGILEITPSASNPRVTERGLWNIFRTNGRDDRQGTVAGDFILNNFSGKNIAIVRDETYYGQRSLADVTKATINMGGLKEVLF